MLPSARAVFLPKNLERAVRMFADPGSGLLGQATLWSADGFGPRPRAGVDELGRKVVAGRQLVSTQTPGRLHELDERGAGSDPEAVDGRRARGLMITVSGRLAAVDHAPQLARQPSINAVHPSSISALAQHLVLHKHERVRLTTQVHQVRPGACLVVGRVNALDQQPPTTGPKLPPSRNRSPRAIPAREHDRVIDNDVTFAQLGQQPIYLGRRSVGVSTGANWRHEGSKSRSAVVTVSYRSAVRVSDLARCDGACRSAKRAAVSSSWRSRSPRSCATLDRRLAAAAVP
jgi:hypothetical protein